jgi:hypothetical protein
MVKRFFDPLGKQWFKDIPDDTTIYKSFFGFAPSDPNPVNALTLAIEAQRSATYALLGLQNAITAAAAAAPAAAPAAGNPVTNALALPANSAANTAVAAVAALVPVPATLATYVTAAAAAILAGLQVVEAANAAIKNYNVATAAILAAAAHILTATGHPDAAAADAAAAAAATGDPAAAAAAVGHAATASAAATAAAGAAAAAGNPPPYYTTPDMPYNCDELNTFKYTYKITKLRYNASTFMINFNNALIHRAIDSAHRTQQQVYLVCDTGGEITKSLIKHNKQVLSTRSNRDAAN